MGSVQYMRAGQTITAHLGFLNLRITLISFHLGFIVKINYHFTLVSKIPNCSSCPSAVACPTADSNSVQTHTPHTPVKTLEELKNKNKPLSVVEVLQDLSSAAL